MIENMCLEQYLDSAHTDISVIGAKSLAVKRDKNRGMVFLLLPKSDHLASAATLSVGAAWNRVDYG